MGSLILLSGGSAIQDALRSVFLYFQELLEALVEYVLLPAMELVKAHSWGPFYEFVMTMVYYFKWMCVVTLCCMWGPSVLLTLLSCVCKLQEIFRFQTWPKEEA
jgi:hypothetical protein